MNISDEKCNVIKCLLCISTTAFFIVLIEWGRRSTTLIPIPFLLLYVSVVISGGIAGKIAGTVSGILASLYVIFAGTAGFGPRTLTGDHLQIFLGSVLYVATGYLIGRARHHRDRLLMNLLRNEAELASKIDERTEALRKNEAQLRLVTDNIPVLVAYVDSDYIVRFANRPYAEFCGIPQDEILGMHLRDVRGDEVFEISLPNRLRTLSGKVTIDEGVRLSADGRQLYFQATRVPHFGDDGRVHGYFMLLSDLTEHREREQQLHQAQKMEVVGQLTGGVAHDFNNILMIVLGNLELLEARLSTGEERQLIGNSMNAARRAAELTHQLLAYSRKQALVPRYINVKNHVERMASLLARTLGETISLQTASQDGLWWCMADPAQLESAIVNLCLNARDAMPEGGTLLIECANARLEGAGKVRNSDAVAGDYVDLSVTDTGTGMPPEILERVFEPFFTTKDVGKGSGLGLSMIYGFAKQSGGHVSVRSEEGKGTTVNLYLPRAEQPSQSDGPQQHDDVPLGRGETVLVIEDDEDVRGLAVELLEGLGYAVIDVADAAAAHQVLENGNRIDVVLSDVVLSGGTSGPKFAEQAQRKFAGLKFIFMSGYSPESAMSAAAADDGNLFLRKPFRLQQLAEALRDALA